MAVTAGYVCPEPRAKFFEHMDSVNVDAFLLDESDGVKGEKGQKVLQHNVNGIVIDDAALTKLKSEVHFRKLNAKSGAA